MKTLSFDLTNEEHALLTDLATYLDHTPESLLRRSIDNLLGEERHKLLMIEEAHRQIERGECYTLEESNRLMAEHIAAAKAARVPAAAE